MYEFTQLFLYKFQFLIELLSAEALFALSLEEAKEFSFPGCSFCFNYGRADICNSDCQLRVLIYVFDVFDYLLLIYPCCPLLL
jgi:hypothetical protein